MRKDIKSMPRVYRDAMNNGTWVDGEFHSDKKLASKGIKVTTTSDGIVHFKNDRIFISTPYDTPNYLWDTFVTGRKQGKTATIATINKKNYYPCKLCSKIKYGGDKCRNCCKSFWPTKKSRIGYLFYLGAMVCSRLLRKWLNNSLNSSRTLNLLSMDSDSQLYEEP